MRLMVWAISLQLTTPAFAQSASIQLHDLYEPTPVTFRFETPGWFVLAGIILLIAFILIVLQLRKYIKNRYRREALHKLSSLDSSAQCIPSLLVILKQTAMHAFGRDKVGPLYGKEWLSFLRNLLETFINLNKVILNSHVKILLGNLQGKNKILSTYLKCKLISHCNQIQGK